MDDVSGVEIVVEQQIAEEELCSLYNAVGWSVYTQDPSRLKAAMDGSHFVVAARLNGRLMGLARCISDGVTIAYLQDVLVHLEIQRRGVGRLLMEACLERFRDIRQMILLTDDRAEQLAFYASLGFSNTRDLKDMPLNAFVRYKGIDLS